MKNALALVMLWALIPRAALADQLSIPLMMASALGADITPLPKHPWFGHLRSTDYLRRRPRGAGNAGPGRLEG